MKNNYRGKFTKELYSALEKLERGEVKEVTVTVTFNSGEVRIHRLGTIDSSVFRIAFVEKSGLKYIIQNGKIDVIDYFEFWYQEAVDEGRTKIEVINNDTISEN